MLEFVHIDCPFCGEGFEAAVDPGNGDAEYIEDCPVCCRPIQMRLRFDADGTVSALQAFRGD